MLGKIFFEYLLVICYKALSDKFKVYSYDEKKKWKSEYTENNVL